LLKVTKGNSSDTLTGERIARDRGRGGPEQMKGLEPERGGVYLTTSREIIMVEGKRGALVFGGRVKRGISGKNQLTANL